MSYKSILTYMKVLNKYARVCKALVVSFIQNAKWLAQFKASLLLQKPNSVEPLDYKHINKCLILAPHSDDEWIGPYAVLTKMDSKDVLYFHCPGGDDMNIRGLRDQEIQKSSLLHGFRLYDIYNYDLDKLIFLIKDYNAFFIPSPIDWHPEHRLVFKAFVKAVKQLSGTEWNNKSYFYYSVTVPHARKEKQFYVRLSASDVKQKWDDFATVYDTQKKMPSKRFKYQLRVAPKECGYAAQFFVKAEIARLFNDFDFISGSNTESKLNNLKQYINNIYRIRKYANKVY